MAATSLLVYFLTNRFQANLSTSERFMRKMYAANLEALLICDGRDLQIIDANPKLLELYGYEHNEILKLSLNDLRLEKSDSVQNNIEQHKTARGQELFMELRVQSAEFNGRTKLIISIKNVTEQFELQHAQLNRGFLMSKKSICQELYLIRMAQSGEIAYSNAPAQKYLVWQEKEVHRFHDLFCDNELERFQELLPSIIDSKDSFYPVVIKMKNHGPESIPMLWEFKAVSNSSGNQIQPLGRHLGDFEKVEAHSNQGSAQLNILLETIQDGFFILNKELNIALANSAFLRLAGKSAEEVIHKPISEVIQRWENTRSSIEIPEAIVNQSSINYETYNPLFDKWFNIYDSPFEDGMAIFYRDVSQEKEHELKLARNEANLQSLINNTRNYIWSLNDKFELLTINSATSEMAAALGAENMTPGVNAIEAYSDPAISSIFLDHYSRVLRGEHISKIF